MVLFDFLTFEDPVINGGMIYAFSVLKCLYKDNKNVIGICKNKNNINSAVKDFISSNNIEVVSFDDGLANVIEQYKIDTFFIGIAQRYNIFDLSSLSCRIIIVCHDIFDIVMYYTGSYYDLDIRDFYIRLGSKYPYLSRVKFIIRHILSFKKPYGIKCEPNVLIEKLGYHNFANIVSRPNTYIVTVSDYSKNAIQYYFNNIANPIKVFYPTFDQIDISSINSISSKNSNILKPYFLIMGGDRFNKNVYTAVKAFEKFNYMHDHKYSLVLLGKTNKKISGSDIVQIEQVHSGELKYLYENAIAFIYPSFCEGFGLPPLEAMSVKVPVLAAYDTSIPEVCGDAVIYFNPYYREDLFKALNTILQDDLRESYIHKGVERFEQVSNRIYKDTKQLIDFISDKTID